jgi:allantoinase
LPSRTITAPNGPPRPLRTFSVASAMARRKNAGFAVVGLANLPCPSLNGESNVSMSQAFRSTRVLTPEGLEPATVVVEGERIAAVRGWVEVPSGAELHDCGDFVLLPGLVDTHVHINEPGRTEWEGFATATSAAAAGGMTTLIDMPLNCIPETINVEALEAKRTAAQGQAWVDWAAWGGVVRGNSDSLLPLAEAGVPGFKCFLIHSGIDGFAWVNECDLRLALERLRGTGLPLLAHAEVAGPVGAATESLRLEGADWCKYATYLASRPDAAEVDAIALLIRLAEEFAHPIHIVHLSSAKALPLIAEARNRGLPITVETCTQYLWFAAEEIADGATEFKCAPPIRGVANREALWGALVEGLIDMVTTDHSPCPPAMKHRDEGRWDLAWGGIASLGLALPVLWTAMSRRHVHIDCLADWMGTAPAQLAGIAGRKGSLSAGADADIVIFDPDMPWAVQPADLRFRHKISPYLGAELRGRVLETWLRGERIFSQDEFIGTPRGSELMCMRDRV